MRKSISLVIGILIIICSLIRIFTSTPFSEDGNFVVRQTIYILILIGGCYLTVVGIKKMFDSE
jgi:hypothetical protein